MRTRIFFLGGGEGSFLARAVLGGDWQQAKGACRGFRRRVVQGRGGQRGTGATIDVHPAPTMRTACLVD